MLADIASDSILDTAFAWLCKQRRDYPDGADYTIAVMATIRAGTRIDGRSGPCCLFAIFRDPFERGATISTSAGHKSPIW